ncbi:hypothetical protein DL765_003904 [Monosporascus sp. GIB2]|nr:hypothetical protein DL765_003904 [Monosporascus sp. GIB2]
MYAPRSGASIRPEYFFLSPVRWLLPAINSARQDSQQVDSEAMDSFEMPTLLVSAITATSILIVAFLSRLRSTRTFNLPILGIEDGDPDALKMRYVQEADVLLREGYEKRHIGHYTTIDHESDIMLGAIKIDLNRNLGTFVGDVEHEVAHCFETQFPLCDDWTPIDLHEKLLRVVAQASARIFVGYPMCRDDEWLECSTKFATDVMTGGEKLKQWHPWLRPVAQHFIPEMTRIRGDHRRALELLLPELRKRKAKLNDPDTPPHNDMIQWMQDRAKNTGDKSFNEKELANLQMLTATAAIHTTRLAIIHALYDLAARPEYIEPLRNEILGVMKDGDGVLQKQHLTQMKMLDSFMKESQRHSPPSVATYQRKAMVPIKLSNGFNIPAGTIVQCNTNILNETPAEWGDPHAFDGFRFYKLRSRPEDANKFQFASPTYDSMQFGFGKDACPGRFFASNQIKIILAYILSHYDIKFEEGVVGRPKNFMFEVNVLADPTKMVLFKKIQ